MPVKQVEALTVGTRREANAGKSKNCGRLTVKWREIQVRTTQNGGKQVKLSKQQRKMAGENGICHGSGAYIFYTYC